MWERKRAALQQQLVSIWHVRVLQHEHGDPLVLERLGRARPRAIRLRVGGDHDGVIGEAVDERFPCACGHDGYRVLFVEEPRDCFFLSRTEGAKAEVVMEGGCE